MVFRITCYPIFPLFFCWSLHVVLKCITTRPSTTTKQFLKIRFRRTANSGWLNSNNWKVVKSNNASLNVVNSKLRQTGLVFMSSMLDLHYSVDYISGSTLFCIDNYIPIYSRKEILLLQLNAWQSSKRTKLVMIKCYVVLAKFYIAILRIACSVDCPTRAHTFEKLALPLWQGYSKFSGFSLPAPPPCLPITSVDIFYFLDSAVVILSILVSSTINNIHPSASKVLTTRRDKRECFY